MAEYRLRKKWHSCPWGETPPSLQGVNKRLSQNAQGKPVLILHVAGVEPDFYLLTRLSLYMGSLVRMMGVFQQERELPWHLNGRPKTAVLTSSGERKMLRSSGKPFPQLVRSLENHLPLNTNGCERNFETLGI